MDHADHHSCSHDLAEKRRKLEPYIFFFGTLAAVLVAIILVVVEANTQYGPDSAQPIHTSPAHHHGHHGH